jgi:hypothetical protein
MYYFLMITKLLNNGSEYKLYTAPKEIPNQNKEALEHKFDKLFESGGPDYLLGYSLYGGRLYLRKAFLEDCLFKLVFMVGPFDDEMDAARCAREIIDTGAGFSN